MKTNSSTSLFKTTGVCSLDIQQESVSELSRIIRYAREDRQDIKLFSTENTWGDPIIFEGIRIEPETITWEIPSEFKTKISKKLENAYALVLGTFSTGDTLHPSRLELYVITRGHLATIRENIDTIIKNTFVQEYRVRNTIIAAQSKGPVSIGPENVVSDVNADTPSNTNS